jgi:hypothetical protein
MADGEYGCQCGGEREAVKAKPLQRHASGEGTRKYKTKANEAIC